MNTVRLWDGATGVPITTFPQSVDSLSRSPVTSRLGSIFPDTFFRNWNGDRGPFISLRQPNRHSRRYCIQGTAPSSNAHIPLLWLPVDISKILCEAFCSKVAAFGGDDGQVIILDLTQLNLQEAVMSG